MPPKPTNRTRALAESASGVGRGLANGASGVGRGLASGFQQGMNYIYPNKKDTNRSQPEPDDQSEDPVEPVEFKGSVVSVQHEMMASTLINMVKNGENVTPQLIKESPYLTNLFAALTFLKDSKENINVLVSSDYSSLTTPVVTLESIPNNFEKISVRENPGFTNKIKEFEKLVSEADPNLDNNQKTKAESYIEYMKFFGPYTLTFNEKSFASVSEEMKKKLVDTPDIGDSLFGGKLPRTRHRRGPRKPKSKRKSKRGKNPKKFT
jgi:hypothetical protein